MYQKADEIIWNLCLKGDRKAFEVLYRRYYPILYNYGKIYSKDTDLVKNCLQNFFVKLMSNYSGLSQTASVRCYLLKAFRYALYNELKSEQIRNGILISCPDDVLTVKADQLLDEEDLSPKNVFISSAFRKLSSKQQEILYLYYIRELNHDEISDLLNINYQSSKNLLFRSIAKLRSLLLSDSFMDEE
ncbi:RNA polymerase sigma factor [Parabacteroides gordonii]|uniref:RNA polymerase sigma factor n=1 Tax=Parabacteroides gordonii TaxID=574930 RepID=UPI0026EBF7EB|nr:sigma-70 family RNA polymerase sigma factor [Parabacteroides gordonii]